MDYSICLLISKGSTGRLIHQELDMLYNPSRALMNGIFKFSISCVVYLLSPNEDKNVIGKKKKDDILRKRSLTANVSHVFKCNSRGTHSIISNYNNYAWFSVYTAVKYMLLHSYALLFIVCFPCCCDFMLLHSLSGSRSDFQWEMIVLFFLFHF